MKKIIILLILAFNLIPNLKKGKIQIGTNLIFAQTTGEEGDPDDGGDCPLCGSVVECDLFPELCQPGSDPTDQNKASLLINSSEFQDLVNQINQASHMDAIAEMNAWEQEMLADGDQALRDFFDEWFQQKQATLALLNLTEIDLQDDGPHIPGTQEPPPPYYYFLSSSDMSLHEHISGSQLTFTTKPGSTSVTLHFWWKNDPSIVPAYMVWQSNGVTVGYGTNAATINISNPGDYDITVLSVKPSSGSAQSTTGFLGNIKLTVYGKSIVRFHQKDNYAGEYGFDEESYKYYNTKADMSKIQIANTTYNVPWASILDGQPGGADIKVEPVLLSTDVTNSYSVDFTSSNNNIKINGQQTVHYTGAQLNSLTSINISGVELDANILNHTKSYITVTNNSGDIIGKLEISCQKPVVKKLVLVYVKTDNTGYPTKNDDAYIDYLNNHSHNQIYKQWELQSKTAFPDMVDLTHEASIDPVDYTIGANVNFTLLRDYQSHTNVNPYAIKNWADGTTDNLIGSDVRKIYFLFITKIKIADISGLTPYLGYPSCYIVDDGTNVPFAKYTAAHELGHALDLTHTFKSIPEGDGFVPNIQEKGDTKNIMDYNKGSNEFFFYQWKYSY